MNLEGKISGSGNVATHAAEKCIELGAIVLTLSDCDGTIHEVNIMFPISLYKYQLFFLFYKNLAELLY